MNPRRGYHRPLSTNIGKLIELKNPFGSSSQEGGPPDTIPVETTRVVPFQKVGEAHVAPTLTVRKWTRITVLYGQGAASESDQAALQGPASITVTTSE